MTASTATPAATRRRAAASAARAGCAATGSRRLARRSSSPGCCIAVSGAAGSRPTTRTLSTSPSGCCRHRPRTGSAPMRSGATCFTRVIYGAPHLASRRLRRGAVGRGLRHAARRRRRLSRGGWAEEALMRADRPGVLLSADHPGDGDRGGAGHRHASTPSSPCWWSGGRNSRASRAAWSSRSARSNMSRRRRSIGFSPAHILLRQIMPNAVGPLVVLVTLDLGNAILIFAGLSFLGLGVVPPTPEWGSMVAEGRELVQQWWVATFPGLRHPHGRARLQLRRRRRPRLARSACATTKR